MIRKVPAVILMLCCIYHYTAFAQWEAPKTSVSPKALWTAVVANPDPADKLFLRPTPDKMGVPLGLYYNGTQVEVLAEAQDTAWLNVRIGPLTGYMARAYLAQGDMAAQVGDMRPVVHVKSQGTMARALLLDGPSASAAVLGHLPNGMAVTVLGVDPAWLHVAAEGITGFMAVSDLTSVEEAETWPLESQAWREQHGRWVSDLPGPDEVLYYETSITVHPNWPPMRLTLWGEANEYGKDEVHCIRIWRDGEAVQALPVQAEQIGSWLDYIDTFLVCEDVNFDGYTDVAICRSAGAYNRFFTYWTWDPVREVFFANRAFSLLRSYPVIEPIANRILCWEKDGASFAQAFEYRVDHGLPVLIDQKDYRYDTRGIATVTHWRRQGESMVKMGQWKE